MNDATLIEIDGVKITPELIAIIKDRFMPFTAMAEETREILFNVQTAILLGISGDKHVHEKLEPLAFALQSLYYFGEEIAKLKKNGKL